MSHGSSSRILWESVPQRYIFRRRPSLAAPFFVCLTNTPSTNTPGRPHITQNDPKPRSPCGRDWAQPPGTPPGAPLEVRGQGEHVSAPLRRGAAPYADGCERVLSHSHPHSLTLSAVLGLSSRLTWHDFAYATMAQKVHSSTLVYPLYPYPSF